VKPNKQSYEKVRVGDFIFGAIEEVQRDEKHKTTYQGKEKISDCVRLKFKLDGYEHQHYSRWMTFNYGAKSTLFSKYLVKLVANAAPDMDFDIKSLEGMRVKTAWTEKNDYQSVDSIFPEKDQLAVNSLPVVQLEEAPALDEEVPF
jgi:hypothetical protein